MNMILFNALKILKHSSFWPVMYFWDCPEFLVKIPSESLKKIKWMLRVLNTLAIHSDTHKYVVIGIPVHLSALPPICVDRDKGSHWRDSPLSPKSDVISEQANAERQPHSQPVFLFLKYTETCEISRRDKKKQMEWRKECTWTVESS